MPANKFEPPKRLHFPWQYRRFFEGSEAIRLSECLIFRIRNDLGHYRLGITLKSRGNSVERNRVKRRIRSAFQVRAGVLGSYDYNVVVPKTKKMSFPYPQRLFSCLEASLTAKLK